MLALLPRLYVAIAWSREAVWDGQYYHLGAKRIAAGFGYSDELLVNGVPTWHPWCHYPVGYSALLGGVYRVFGDGARVAPVTNAILGALLVAVVHRLARYAMTPERARIAALLAAFIPGLVVYAPLVMTEPVAALGTVLAAWLMARDADRHPFRGALLAGIVVGLSTLVRPPSLACAPALALIAAAAAPHGVRWRRGVVVGVIGLAASAAVIAPWTMRNCRVMDGCALVSTNAGWNLAIGAFPRATGRFETLRSEDGCREVTGQVQQDRCWLRLGLGWIGADPVRWLGLVPAKLGYTFDHESFPVGYLGEADKEGWPEARRDRMRRFLGATHAALLCAAALAFVRSPMRGRRGLVETALALVVIVGLAALGVLSDFHPFWPVAVAVVALALVRRAGPGADGPREGVLSYLACAVAVVAVTAIVFFGEDRYHVVVTPALCILAAAALARPQASDEVDCRR